MAEAPTTALTTTNGGRELAPVNIWNREKIDLLKATICRDATDAELQLFIHVCKRTGLDPFARQIHAVKRYDSNLGKEVMSIQTGIDGFRVLAERSGHYRGQTEPEWCGDDGEWLNVWLAETPPVAARVGVLREGFADPVYATARYKAFVQKKKDGAANIMWSKMDAEMLAKCAEAMALRKAFPNDMSGLYLPEEIGKAGVETKSIGAPTRKSEAKPPQAEEMPPASEPEEIPYDGPRTTDPPRQQSPDSPLVSDAQRKRFYAISKSTGKTDEQIKTYLQDEWGINSTKEITKAMYEAACEWAGQ